MKLWIHAYIFIEKLYICILIVLPLYFEVSMRFILKIGMILVSGVAIGLLFPTWWSLCIVAALVGFLLSEVPRRRAFADKKQSNIGNSFLAGLIAGIMLWGVWAFWKDMGNDMILSNRISELVLSKSIPYTMILITALLGGLITAFSTMTGGYLGVVIKSGFAKKR